jgi:hypothetical protein
MRLLVLVTQEQKFCHELARPLRSAVVMDQQEVRETRRSERR